MGDPYGECLGCSRDVMARPSNPAADPVSHQPPAPVPGKSTTQSARVASLAGKSDRLAKSDMVLAFAASDDAWQSVGHPMESSAPLASMMWSWLDAGRQAPSHDRSLDRPSGQPACTGRRDVRLSP